MLCCSVLCGVLFHAELCFGCAVQFSHLSLLGYFLSVLILKLLLFYLLAVVVKECYFKSQYCGWTSLGEKFKKWKLSTDKTFVNFPGKVKQLRGFKKDL